VTAAKNTGARALAPASLDVAQSPVSADLVATVVEDLVNRHLGNADASGLGLAHDATKRALTRHIGQLRRLHADDPGE
jgi:hypothetical protein